MKRVVVLGSTGSIGKQTLDVIKTFPDKLALVGVAAGRNVDLMAEQIREFSPNFGFFDGGPEKGSLPNGLDCQACSMEEMVAHPDVDLVVVATVGKVGLRSTLAAIRAGKNVALANKEVIVMAGSIIMDEARRAGVQILPVDSEPSAIWQCLEEGSDISRIFLTASGGPFRNSTSEEMADIGVDEAMRHPTWQMGPKITIDSATLMNKGLEVIEASWMFGVSFEQVEVVVHPQSVIHSMVEFSDGSVKAQLSPPDMRLPIQIALSYPERWHNQRIERLDPVQAGTLTFETVDFERFPCFKLAIDAGRMGGTYPAVLNACDDVAVEMFLSGRIRFLEISGIVGRTLDAHSSISAPNLDEIVVADEWARGYARSQVPE